MTRLYVCIYRLLSRNEVKTVCLTRPIQVCDTTHLHLYHDKFIRIYVSIVVSKFHKDHVCDVIDSCV